MANVLLTTMSTIQRRDSVNYYVTGDGMYASGIASIEPGAKYFLSDERRPVSRMIVLGSPETYTEEDSLKTENLLGEYEQLKNQDKRKMSDYAFFKYRMCQFLNGDGIEEDRLESTVEEERRKDLQQIAEKVLTDAGFRKKQEWFSAVTEDSRKGSLRLTKKIRDAIQEDIEKNFVRAEDYRKYEDPATFPERIAVETKQQTIEQIEQHLNDIDALLKDKKNAPDLGREALYTDSMERVQAWRSQLEQNRLSDESAKYEAILKQLSETIQKLIAEIASLKNNRAGKEYTYVQHYLYSLVPPYMKMKYAGKKTALPVTFVPEKINGRDNIYGIIDEIRGDGKEEVSLYIDMQGGNRTDGYVRNAILSVLNNENYENVNIRKIVATNFRSGLYAHEIVDETKRYSITDLVSGMNAFIQYGKADLLHRYVKEKEIRDPHVIGLVNEMVSIDHALSICDIDRITASIQNLKKILNAGMDENDPDSDVFRILQTGIERDYQNLLMTDDFDYGDLAQWALDHKFTQQALTIIEAKMPYEFIRKGVTSYARNEADKAKALNAFADLYHNCMETKAYELYKFNDIDHYFVKFSYKEALRNNVSFPKYEVSADAQALLSSYRNLGNLRNTLNHANATDDEMMKILNVSDTAKENPDWKNNALVQVIQDYLNLYGKFKGAEKNTHVVRISLDEVKKRADEKYPAASSASAAVKKEGTRAPEEKTNLKEKTMAVSEKPDLRTALTPMLKKEQAYRFRFFIEPGADERGILNAAQEQIAPYCKVKAASYSTGKQMLKMMEQLLKNKASVGTLLMQVQAEAEKLAAYPDIILVFDQRLLEAENGKLSYALAGKFTGRILVMKQESTGYVLVSKMTD